MSELSSLTFFEHWSHLIAVNIAAVSPINSLIFCEQAVYVIICSKNSSRCTYLGIPNGVESTIVTLEDFAIILKHSQAHLYSTMLYSAPKYLMCIIYIFYKPQGRNLQSQSTDLLSS